MVLLIDHVWMFQVKGNSASYIRSKFLKNIEIHLNSGKTTCKSEIESLFLAYLVVDSSLSSSRDITGRKQLWTSCDKTLKAVYVTNWKFKCHNINQLKDRI